MKKKSGSDVLIRNTGKIDFTFFNFPVLTSSILEMFANSDRSRTTIPRAGAEYNLLPAERKRFTTR
jgi:hypothetical protein